MSKQYKILLVDDDAPILKALTVRLTHQGYQVITAKDAMSAVICVRNERPDLAILDINMPGTDGFQLAETFDSNPGPFIPRIFVTANKQPALRTRAAELNASGFYEKPFDSQALLDCISTTISQPSVSVSLREA